MFNERMDKEETVAVIDAGGGDKAFGKLLGIDGDEGFQQRVNNWRRRGMPAEVVLEHYELIQKLRADAAAARDHASGASAASA
jgi:hypothetical protein